MISVVGWVSNNSHNHCYLSWICTKWRLIRLINFKLIWGIQIHIEHDWPTKAQYNWQGTSWGKGNVKEPLMHTYSASIALKSTNLSTGPHHDWFTAQDSCWVNTNFLLHQRHRLRNPAPRSCHHRTQSEITIHVFYQAIKETKKANHQKVAGNSTSVYKIT